MLIGYVRYVPAGPDETKQIKTMSERSIGKYFTEQTGNNAEELRARQDLLNFAREGDSVLVYSIPVIARNINELLDIICQLDERGVTFISLSEEIDTSDERGKFLLRILKSMANLDADSLVDKKREETAKALAAQAAQAQAAPGAPAAQSKHLPPPMPKPGQPGPNAAPKPNPGQPAPNAQAQPTGQPAPDQKPAASQDGDGKEN